jgi:hypothetical protein
MDLRIVTAPKVQVYILFYKPTISDPFQNRLVAFVDGPFCHVVCSQRPSFRITPLPPCPLNRVHESD